MFIVSWIERCLYKLAITLLPYDSMRMIELFVIHILLVRHRTRGLLPIVAISQAISSSSRGSANNPPSPVISGMAKVSPAITGVPQAIASQRRATEAFP